MNKAVLTMGKKASAVGPLVRGITDQRFFFSYGNQIPDLTDFDTSYWMAGIFAMRLQAMGLAQSLSSPGEKWLTQIDTAFTQRKIYEGTLEDLGNFDSSSTFWIKPSEAKIHDMPAGRYSYPSVKEIFERNDYTLPISLQWTDSVLPMNYEHRFFILDGEVVTGSTYLVNRKVWNPLIDTSKYDEAKQFAEHVLKNVPTPQAFTLDVALNEDTNTWLVIEGNRAWSSGIYGSDPTLALEVIHASGRATDWLWTPDEHVLFLNEKISPVEILPLSEIDSADFYEYRAEV